MQLYDKIRHEGIRPAAFNRDAEKLLTQIAAEVERVESASTELKELTTLLKNAHLMAILQAQDVVIDEVFTSGAALEKSESDRLGELPPCMETLIIEDNVRSVCRNCTEKMAKTGEK